MRSRQVVLALLCLALGGCARACKNDHPYVPGAEPSASGAPDAAAPEPSATAALAVDGGVEPAFAPPPGTTSIVLDGAEVSVPEREIVLVLSGDFDGDGKKDALAVVRPPAGPDGRGGSSAGELVHLRGGAPAAGAIATGPVMSVDPSCVPTARLERIGPRSAFAEIGTACTKGSGARAIWVVRLGPALDVAFDATITDPLSAPKLAIDAEAADRDKDGIDDVVLRVTIEGGAAPFEPGPRLTAKLAFFDRPAGPSRDAEEPEASLRAIAAQATARAGRTKDAPGVPGMVQQMRALYRALCREGGAPRIDKIHGGSAPSCGASKPLEDAGVAEVRAWVTQGDAVRAFAAADQASVAPATRTAARVAEVQKLLAEVAPAMDARSSRALNVLADAPRPQHPEWGPLSFESSAKLLVRHGEKVSRVDLATFEQEDADVPAWPAHVVSPDGKMRWLEAYHACEGVALRATFAPVAEGDVQDVLLPVAPRLGTRCAGGRGEAAMATPVAWGPRGLETIVSGQPLLVRLDTQNASALAAWLDEPPPRGSPRSPGGRAIAIATPQGLLVRAEKTTLRRASDLAPAADLRHCTTTDDGLTVACLKKGRVVVAQF